MLACRACLAVAVSVGAFCTLASRAAAQPTTPPTQAGMQGQGDGSGAARDTDGTDDVDLDAGGQLGYAHLDDHNFAAPTLAADLRAYFFQAAFRIPLRFRLDTGDIRRADWDELGDYFRVASCVRIDVASGSTFEREHGFCSPWQVGRDDHYFTVHLAPLYDFSLGHGTIVTHYSNNIDPDHFHPGLIGHLKLHEVVVGDFFVDDATNPSLIGGVFGIRPISFEREDSDTLYGQTHQIEIDVTAVSDLQAPDRVRTAFGGALTDDHHNLLYTTSPLTVLGGDMHYRYVFGTQIEAEGRLDWNWIVQHGMGGHGQLWFIYNHPDGDYTVRGIGELRYFQNDYVPDYFNSYYDIQRQQQGLTQEARALLTSPDNPFLTKLQFLDQLDSSGWIAGYYGGLVFEAFAGDGDARRSVFVARMFVGDNFSRPADGQFVFTLEVPRLAHKIDIYGLYSRQSFDTIGDIFQLRNTLVRLIVRWDLNQQFYLLMNYGRIWQVQADLAGLSEAGFVSGTDFNISVGFAEGL